MKFEHLSVRFTDTNYTVGLFHLAELLEQVNSLFNNQAILERTFDNYQIELALENIGLALEETVDKLLESSGMQYVMLHRRLEALRSLQRSLRKLQRRPDIKDFIHPLPF